MITRLMILLFFLCACGPRQRRGHHDTQTPPGEPIPQAQQEDSGDPNAEPSLVVPDPEIERICREVPATLEDDRAFAGGQDGDVPPIYDPSKMHIVAITLPEWDTLRNQRPSYPCQPDPTGGHHGYTSFTADVVIDGVTLTGVKVRKKSHCGSLSSDKPALVIKVKKSERKKVSGSIAQLTLNNSLQDPSFIRQCLAYEMLRAVKIPASFCSFIDLSVNGMPIGVYVNVEPLKRSFFERNFGDDAEGTVESDNEGDFEPRLQQGLQIEDDEIATRAAVDSLKDSLAAGNHGRLRHVIDVPDFIRYWASEILIAHIDGYAHSARNFSMFQHSADHKLRFLHHGIDRVLGDGLGAREQPSIEGPAYFKAIIPRALQRYPACKDALKREVNTQLDLLGTFRWEERAEELAAVVHEYLAGDKRAATTEHVDSMVSFVKEYMQQLRTLSHGIN